MVWPTGQGLCPHVALPFAQAQAQALALAPPHLLPATVIDWTTGASGLTRLFLNAYPQQQVLALPHCTTNVASIHVGPAMPVARLCRTALPVFLEHGCVCVCANTRRRLWQGRQFLHNMHVLPGELTQLFRGPCAFRVAMVSNMASISAGVCIDLHGACVGPTRVCFSPIAVKGAVSTR